MMRALTRLLVEGGLLARIQSTLPRDGGIASSGGVNASGGASSRASQMLAPPSRVNYLDQLHRLLYQSALRNNNQPDNFQLIWSILRLLVDNIGEGSSGVAISSSGSGSGSSSSSGSGSSSGGVSSSGSGSGSSAGGSSSGSSAGNGHEVAQLVPLLFRWQADAKESQVRQDKALLALSLSGFGLIARHYKDEALLQYALQIQEQRKAASPSPYLKALTIDSKGNLKVRGKSSSKEGDRKLDAEANIIPVEKEQILTFLSKIPALKDQYGSKALAKLLLRHYPFEESDEVGGGRALSGSIGSAGGAGGADSGASGFWGSFSSEDGEGRSRKKRAALAGSVDHAGKPAGEAGGSALFDPNSSRVLDQFNSVAFRSIFGT
jgi:hypothetical protein